MINQTFRQYKKDTRYTLAELAEQFGVSINKVFRWCQDGVMIEGKGGSLRVIQYTEPRVLAKQRKFRKVKRA